MILDERIARELKEHYTELSNAGKLISREQLANYYTLFRRRFGPDRLKSLDGEALLETMHSHGTKESMVYWLEFKDDDEFASPSLGSIAGGSAHKFGIFRKQDTGQWTTGFPQKEQILTLEEAIEKARTHRDQLVKGAELLEQFPPDGSDADYVHLQQDMERVAPDINNSAWGTSTLAFCILKNWMITIILITSIFICLSCFNCLLKRKAVTSRQVVLLLLPDCLLCL